MPAPQASSTISPRDCQLWPGNSVCKSVSFTDLEPELCIPCKKNEFQEEMASWTISFLPVSAAQHPLPKAACNREEAIVLSQLYCNVLSAPEFSKTHKIHIHFLPMKRIYASAKKETPVVCSSSENEYQEQAL